MTLILAQASQWFAMEVSDRLVTRAGATFDPASNKNVLFFAKDAIVAFGYTGLAYIEGITTDQWVAEALIGKELTRDRRPPILGFGTGSVQRTHIGPAIQRLEMRLTRVFREMKRRGSSRKMPLEILGSGWQWSRRRTPRPIVVSLQKSADELQFKVRRSPRHIGRSFVFAATPEANLTQPEVDAMRSVLRDVRSPDDAEDTLVQTIRTVSTRSSCVGPDCMSILIPPPPTGWVRIRYLPSSTASLVIRSRSDGNIRATAPAAFSPWVVSPSLVSPPSVLTGPFSLGIGSFTVHLEAPSAKGSSLLGAMGSVERPAEPR